MLDANLTPLLKGTIFQCNDAIARSYITTSVTNYMSFLKNNRAIDDFCVVCDETNNSPSAIANDIMNLDVAVKTLYGDFSWHIYIDDPLIKVIYKENETAFRISPNLISEIKQKLNDICLKYTVATAEIINDMIADYTLIFADDTNSAQFMLYIAPDYKIEDFIG
jgi:hypothetical protein